MLDDSILLIIIIILFVISLTFSYTNIPIKLLIYLKGNNKIITEELKDKYKNF